MLAGLVLRLVDLPPLAVYDIWRKALHFMAGQTREEFLSNIRLLIVLVFALAGERPVYETVGSIHEVGRWWP